MKDLIPKDPANKAIEETAKLAEKFLGELVVPALKESGRILSDTVNFWRFKNQINLVLKAKEFLEAKGIQPSRVLPKTLLPIIENGSLEEDFDMRDRWSAMLAHAADSSSGVRIRPGYPEILKQLSPVEVKLLDAFYNSIKNIQKEQKQNTAIIKDKILKIFYISPSEYDILVGNLFRLGLCERLAPMSSDKISDFPAILLSYDMIRFTPFGFDFIKACKY